MTCLPRISSLAGAGPSNFERKVRHEPCWKLVLSDRNQIRCRSHQGTARRLCGGRDEKALCWSPTRGWPICRSPPGRWISWRPPVWAGACSADVDPNPNEKNLEAGVAAYNAGGHDGVIAFGGGSGLDLGKMVAFMAGQTRPVWDFEDIGDWWTRADADAIAPIIAVPTTAGTGSEVGRASVITNSETHAKKIIFHPKVLPTVVICDPELTVGMPKFITAGTGLDAFAHCVEAFSSPHYHPMSQGIALEGMRLVKEIPATLPMPTAPISRPAPR